MKERHSGIELLRIIAAFSVIILHYNGHAFNILSTETETVNYTVLLFFDCFCTSAVNIFIMISGYFSCTSDRRTIAKPINLLAQTIIYRELFYIITVLHGTNILSAKRLFLHFIPNNYFVILYIALYLISPYINKGCRAMSKREFKRMLILLLIVFSFWNIGVDVLKGFSHSNFHGLSTIGIESTQYGYSIVNFLLLYLIGAYIRLHNVHLNKNFCIIGYFACTAIIFIWAVKIKNLFSPLEASCIYGGYHNPLVIAQALFAVLLFGKFSFKNRFINEMSGAAFTCYLIHGFFLPRLQIDRYVHDTILIMLAHILITIVLIYILSYGTHKVYTFFTNRIFRKLNRYEIHYWK